MMIGGKHLCKVLNILKQSVHMKYFTSLFLLAFVAFIGVCPSIMANASMVTCHQVVNAESAQQTDDTNGCIHTKIVKNTILPSGIEIVDTEVELADFCSVNY